MLKATTMSLCLNIVLVLDIGEALFKKKNFTKSMVISKFQIFSKKLYFCDMSIVRCIRMLCNVYNHTLVNNTRDFHAHASGLAASENNNLEAIVILV